MGASPVVGIDRIPMRLEMAGRFGFDEVLSLAELTEVEDRVKAVRSMTRGLGADVVVEVGLPPPSPSPSGWSAGVAASSSSVTSPTTARWRSTRSRS